MNTEELVKKTTELAKKQGSLHNYGTEFLDRTIYYGKIKTDSNEKPLVDPNGQPIVEIKTYATAGRWISPQMMEKALEIEKQFLELNEYYRKGMEQQHEQWKLRKHDIRAIEIVSNLLTDDNEEKVFNKRKKK